MSETLLRQLAMRQLVPRAPRLTTATSLQRRLADQDFQVKVRSVQPDLGTLSAVYCG